MPRFYSACQFHNPTSKKLGQSGSIHRIQPIFPALYEVTCHAIWLQNFILVLRVVHSIYRPLKLFCDNVATVSFSRNTSCFKYIDVKFYFVKEKVVESLILVEHTLMTSMLETH